MSANRETRKWDVAATEWHKVGLLLDKGWEPFAVVQRQPNSQVVSTQATVYLRRPAVLRESAEK